MDFPVQLGKDVKADLKISGGKVVLTVEFAGGDAALDSLKPHLPPWLGPAIDLLKAEVLDKP